MAGMSNLRNICVYCGSSPGTDPDFVAAASHFGKIVAENRIGLVYGGGSTGLMGALAHAVDAHDGEVVGVIPEFLRLRERMFKRAREIVVTQDMHERKRIMFERADAFVALPGGIGTLEELVEQLTWAQLGRHKKPILIVNLKNYWDGLIELFDHMNRLGFIHAAGLLSYHVCDKVEDILPTLRAALATVTEEEEAGDTEVVEKL
jgi:uncharacterized protein (TIGR00730 family)